MDSFIQKYTDMLYNWKKNVFNYATTKEFIEKQLKKEDNNKVKSELTKCLFGNSKNVSEKEEKEEFITSFLKEIDSIRKIANEKVQIVDESSVYQSKEGFNIKKKKVKNIDVEYPKLENTELLNRKKNYEILPHHYNYIMSKGIKLCGCMRKKHPLVGNCNHCGYIQCLQEGDEICIICGNILMTKTIEGSLMKDDTEYKKAYEHKEKLLKFQKNFYSKLQIIDDYSDWYDISNNPWVDDVQRSFAKEKEISIQKMKEDPEWEYNVNFMTGEITQEYNDYNDEKNRKEIADYIINQYKTKESVKEKKNEDDQISKCDIITKEMISQYIKDNEKKVKSGRVDSQSQINKLTIENQPEAIIVKKLRLEIDKQTEVDNFHFQKEKGMCLSMHQPWASLLVYGFKRFEGRDWNSDYKGKLWIHATSKKPDKELIESIESECKRLYNTNHPCFPKIYPTSCILGCVDMVDCINKSEMDIQIPKCFQETNTSQFLFVCKNPMILDVNVKLPGQPKIFQLENDIIEKLEKIGITKVNTKWWPTSNLNCEKEMRDVSFERYIYNEKRPKENNTVYKGGNNQKSNDVFIIGKVIEDLVYLLKENSKVGFISELIKKRFLTDKEKYKDYIYAYNNQKEPEYSQYTLYKVFNSYENDYIILKDRIVSEVKSMGIVNNDYVFNIKNIKIEVFNIYSSKNLTHIEDDTLFILIGNPIMITIEKDIYGINTLNNSKSIILNELEVLFFKKNSLINESLLYSIPQVMYSSEKTDKKKYNQGSVVISIIKK